MTTLAIFAKAPEAGRVKTRLAAEIGDAAALAVYHQLLQHTAGVATRWPEPVRVFATGSPTIFDTCPLAGFRRDEQVAGDLGRRLRHGLRRCLEEDERVIAIGTDSFTATAENLLSCARLLDGHQALIAPVSDGGYWALGLASRRACDCCCASDLPWSQADLQRATAERCRAHGIALAHGPPGDDLDTLADLQRARALGFGEPV